MNYLNQHLMIWNTCNRYRPSIPLDQVRRILKFDSIADALKFLEELGVAKCLSQDGAYLDCHGVSSNLTSAI